MQEQYTNVRYTHRERHRETQRGRERTTLGQMEVSESETEREGRRDK